MGAASKPFSSRVDIVSNSPILQLILVLILIYSTVTTLAKFLGMSGLIPRLTDSS